MTALGGFASTPRNRTAHEYVKAAIRDAILDGTLAPGARLVQADLAAQLGVSTTPIREALRDLATEGLIHTDPHRGALVRAFDIGEVEEIYQLRILLEPVMIRRLGGRIAPAALARAEELHQRMTTERRISGWVELNRQFHAALASSEDGSRLSSILDSLRDASAPWVRLSLGTGDRRIEESLVEHAELLRLYREGDVDELVDATVRHLRGTLSLTQQAAEAAASDAAGEPSP